VRESSSPLGRWSSDKLMACLGSGAVAAGLLLGRAGASLGLEGLVAAGCVVFAVVMAVAALVRIPWIVYVALVIGGAAWMAVMSTFNTATMTSAPPWVRSRASALHTLSALGSFAIGSAFWGAVSGIAGLTAALCAAALSMASGLLLARPFPLRMEDEQDVTPGTPWQELVVVAEPSPEDGPVAVEIGYRIQAGKSADFLDAVTRLRAPRRRDGTTFWRVYRDMGDSSRYVERFIVTS
jgi:MFS family permease